MLTCLACSKRVQDSSMDELGVPHSPSTRETVRCLTNQLKEMAVKFSTAYRHCRPPCAFPDFQQDGRCIDSMDITDASSDASTSNAPSVGSFYSTPPQSFRTTPRRITNKLASSRKNGFSSSAHRSASERMLEIAAKGEGLDSPRTPAGSRTAACLEVGTEDEAEKEWVAQVEPGVLITFLAMCDGLNELKRIRFSRDMFNKWQAQQWWAENCEKVHELYNVPRLSKADGIVRTPLRSEDELRTIQRESKVPSGDLTPTLHSWRSVHDRPFTPRSPAPPRSHKSRRHAPPDQYHSTKLPRPLAGRVFPGDPPLSDHCLSEAAFCDGSMPMLAPASNSRTSSSTCPVASCASDVDADARPLDDPQSSCEVVSDAEFSECVEEDEPGVYITVRCSAGGMRELKRVRFSREKFTEVQARLWWEENRLRVYEQYL